MRKMELNRPGRFLAALAVGVSAAVVPATQASAEIQEYWHYNSEGDRVVREAWLNYNTDDGYVRAHAAVRSIHAAFVALDWVCLQNQHGDEQCGGAKSARRSNPEVHQVSPAWPCTPGVHYRSIARWRAAGHGADGAGTIESRTWWPCPARP